MLIDLSIDREITVDHLESRERLISDLDDLLQELEEPCSQKSALDISFIKQGSFHVVHVALSTTYMHTTLGDLLFGG